MQFITLLISRRKLMKNKIHKGKQFHVHARAVAFSLIENLITTGAPNIADRILNRSGRPSNIYVQSGLFCGFLYFRVNRKRACKIFENIACLQQIGTVYFFPKIRTESVYENRVLSKFKTQFIQNILKASVVFMLIYI